MKVESFTVVEPESSSSAVPNNSDNKEDSKNCCVKVLEIMNKYRDIVSFWIFGLCNNFAYVVMLSAAHDILNDIQNNGNGTNTGNNTTGNHSGHENTTARPEPNLLICNAISTGSILLADILPTLILKMSFPFFLQQIPYIVKITTVSVLAAMSFIIVAYAETVWVSILGVVCASLSSGLGEITFLSLTTFYQKNVVSSWSSGTGGAGVFGALVYAGFTSIGLSPRTSLLILIAVPAILMIFYIFVLPSGPIKLKKDDDEETDFIVKKDTNPLTYKEKFKLVPSLLKYMLPLSLVYYAEYFINQGLHELLYFNDVWLSSKEQYRWFQVDYQIGVFISRSSVNLFQIKKLWVLPILQFGNMALLICQVYYRFIPNLWIIIAIVLFEGFLGGAAYVNTFYRMTNDLPSRVKEFCIGVATLGDSIGIAFAGASAIPFHNHICKLKLKI